MVSQDGKSLMFYNNSILWLIIYKEYACYKAYSFYCDLKDNKKKFIITSQENSSYTIFIIK